MGNINLMYMLDDIEEKIDIIKTVFILICTYYTNLKITNQKIKINTREILYNVIIILLYILFICEFNKLGSMLSIMLLESLIFSRENIGYGILTTIISLSVNYIVLIISLFVNYILNYIIGVNNNYINLAAIIIIHLGILYNIFK